MFLSQRTLLMGYAVVIVLAVVRVSATYRVFSETLDEPVHVLTGLQWLVEGRYDIDGTHPPLARVVSAIPAWIERIGMPGQPGDRVARGNEILYSGGRYEHNLSRARAGNLVFLILLIAGTAVWARRSFPEPVPLIAALLVSLLPPMLAHAGLATTDLAVAAMLTISLALLERYLAQPSVARAAGVGMAVGLGVLSKFSFLVFFPVAVLIACAVQRSAGTLRGTAIALLVAFVIVWAGYRFDFRRISSIPGAMPYVVQPVPAALQPAAVWIAARAPLPAPHLFIGIGALALHDQRGHLTFLLGRYSETGWWYYFPVVLFFKTPIPFFLLSAGGIWLAVRHRAGFAFAAVPLAILGVAMTSSINIGIRHILPLYPGLAILAAAATVELWRQRIAGRIAVAVLVIWIAAGSVLAHPDYLAWFNEAAGTHPERIAVDSNLDWGQDVLRLQSVVRSLRIDTLHADIATNARLFAHVPLAGGGLSPFTRTKGWVAVSETALVLHGRHGEYGWLTGIGWRRVGKSIRLYYVR